MNKFLFFLILITNYVAALEYNTVHLAVPGPGNISYLPIEIISKIGADQAQGIQLKLIYTGGSSLALAELTDRNAEFAAAGLPAQIFLRTAGKTVFTIAAIDDAPLFILMVRQELTDQIKTIADLRGRIIGVSNSSRLGKTTSRQLMELLLRNAGVPLDSVHFVSAGQSWREQSSLIISGNVDALMSNEPFATRLLQMGKVFFLVNLAHLQNTQLPGANFLHAALATRSDIIDHAPQLVEKMIHALQSTLQWMNKHSPEEIVAQLEISDSAERDALLNILHIYPNLYSPDGRFSHKQIRATEDFFNHAASQDLKEKIDLESQLIDRWVGRKD